ncbi:MAG: GNAT family N-acetyltransferase [Hominimerdicola sp.]
MIRKALPNELNAVDEIYNEIFLYEKEHGAYTVWKQGVYPTRQTSEKSLSEGTLYVLEQNGEICASMIANQKQPQEYYNVKWKYNSDSDEIFIIHLLCVKPSKSGFGFGKQLVQFAITQAKNLNCKTVRLDTGSQNKPAVALYTKLGFELAGTSTMSVGGVISHKNHLFFEIKV